MRDIHTKEAGKLQLSEPNYRLGYSKILRPLRILIHLHPPSPLTYYHSIIIPSFFQYYDEVTWNYTYILDTYLPLWQHQHLPLGNRLTISRNDIIHHSLIHVTAKQSSNRLSWYHFLLCTAVCSTVVSPHLPRAQQRKQNIKKNSCKTGALAHQG